MKKFKIKKPYVALVGGILALTLGTISLANSVTPNAAKAAEETISFVFYEQGYSNEEDFTSLTIDYVTVSATIGTNSNNNSPKYYNTGTGIRIYGGNTLTISTTLGSITQVAFTVSNAQLSVLSCSDDITFNVDTDSNIITCDPVSELNLYNVNTSGNIRIQQMDVTIDTGDLTISGFSVTPTSASYTTIDVLEETDFTVSGTRSDSVDLSSSDYTVEIGTLNDGVFTSRTTVIWGETQPTTDDNNIRFTSRIVDANDEYPYVDVTITVSEPEFTSISISGDMSIKEYYAGYSFDPAGLTVTASPGEVDITSEVEWTFDPTTAEVGTEQVTVRATYGELENTTTITGIEVLNVVVDTLTVSYLGITGNYADIENVTSDTSNVTYVGNIRYNNGNIQMNTTSGVGIATANNGFYTVRSITVDFTSTTSRTVNIYANNEPYTSAASVDGETLVGSLTYSSSDETTFTYEFTDDYTDFRIASSSGALYLTYVEVVWNVVEPTPLQEAVKWAKSFITDLTCDEDGIIPPSTDEWNALKESYEAISDDAKAYFANGAEVEDEYIKAAIKKYDYIIDKYDYTDDYTNFIGRYPEIESASIVDNPITNVDYVTIIAIVMSVLALTSIGAFIIIYRKRKLSSK